MLYREQIQIAETNMLQTFETEFQKLEDKKRKLVNHKDWCQNKLSRLLIEMEETLPRAFKAIDFEVISFSPVVYYNDAFDYNKEPPSMTVKFTCKMVGRRKPWADYNFNRTEKNRRQEKCFKDQDKFAAATGGKYKCSLNEHMFKNADRVIIDVSI